MTQRDSESPAVPADVRDALDACSDRQLRAIVHDAQTRLEAHPPLTEEVDLAEGEAFVSEEAEIDGVLRDALETGEDSLRRALVTHARHRLEDRPPLTDVIEAREHEELVRMEDHGSYTTVILRRPEATSEARGPFAYMVQWEPHLNDEGKYKWHYLGRVIDEGGD